MAGNLSTGFQVRLHSLQAAAQHNGVDGHLLNWNASKGRWDVKLSTGQELAVRPANLTLMCSCPGCEIGATEAAGEGFKMCGQCREVTYCSNQCQLTAWKDGHKHECKQRQEDRQNRVRQKMVNLYAAVQFTDVVSMEKEGLAVAEELQSARPGLAASIYQMLGHSFGACKEHLKCVELLQRAKELAAEAGECSVLNAVCMSLGNHHQRQGEHEKAIVELEQGRAIAVEQGHRVDEGGVCGNLGVSYMSLKQCAKATELFEQSLAIHTELVESSAGEAMRSQMKLRQGMSHISLGRCLSRQGRHEQALASLRQAWAVLEGLPHIPDKVLEALRLGIHICTHTKTLKVSRVRARDARAHTHTHTLSLTHTHMQVQAAMRIGEALWKQVRAGQHEQGLKDAEFWLRTAFDLAMANKLPNLFMESQVLVGGGFRL